MLVYGYVNEIETYSIKMALPNGIMGTVPITDVSPTYTEMIQQFAAKSKTEQEQEGEVRIIIYWKTFTRISFYEHALICI